MKNFITQVGSVLAVASLSLMSLSCGDKEKEGAGTDPGKEGSGSGETGGKKADLEAEMVGYWAPNAKNMTALLQKEVADDPAAAALIPMFTAAMGGMAVEVQKGSVTMHVMGNAQKSTYTVKSVDAATKTISMDVTDDSGTGEGSATIDGDTLTLAKKEKGPGETLILDRITKEDFEKRLKAKPPAGLPGLEDESTTPEIPGIPPIPVPEPIDSELSPEPVDSEPAPEPIDSEPAPEPIDSEPAPAPEPE